MSEKTMSGRVMNGRAMNGKAMRTKKLSTGATGMFIVASLMGAPAALAAPPACTCKDLPVMVKEIIEQEWLGKKFRDWADYMPTNFTTPARMQNRAQEDFTAHFYPKSESKDSGKDESTAGTTDGGHAALGTLYDSEDCGIGEFQYSKNGKPVNQKGQEIVLFDDQGKPEGNRTPPKDNDHWLKRMTEEQYMKKGNQCEALVRYPWIHEKHHQDTCKKLKAEGKSKSWENMAFFARNDAESYAAGANYLRQQTKALALKCGWEGSTGENAVPPPDKAGELAKKGAKANRNRGGKKKVGSKSKGTAKIIQGVTIDTSPMSELLARWEKECADEEAPGCGALGASIEIGLIDLLRGLQHRGGVDRQTLFDAAHADSPQLQQLAMSMMYNAQNAEEIEFALSMTESSSPAVRETARQMLQGSDDPRWEQISHLWNSSGDTGPEALVPDLQPRAQTLGVNTLDGLRHRPYAGNRTSVVFTTSETPDAVVKRIFRGKQVMTNASDLEDNMKNMEAAMMSMQQEMMQAAQSGDIKKMTEMSAKFAEMQKKFMPADPAAVNADRDSIGILLERDQNNGVPLLVARVSKDEKTGQTLVVFERRPR